MTMWEKLTLGVGVSILVGGFGLQLVVHNQESAGRVRNAYAAVLCREALAQYIPQDRRIKYKPAPLAYCEKTMWATLEYMQVRVETGASGTSVVNLTDLENLYVLSKLLTITGEVAQIESVRQHNQLMEGFEQ